MYFKIILIKMLEFCLTSASLFCPLHKFTKYARNEAGYASPRLLFPKSKDVDFDCILRIFNEKCPKCL